MQLSLLQYQWCHNCGAYGPKKRCGGCKDVRYCDRTCQETSWNDTHKHDSMIKTVLSRIAPLYNVAVEEFLYAWHGQWVYVLMIPRSMEANWPKDFCDAGLYIASHWKWKCTRFCLKVLKAENAYEQSLTRDGPCGCQPDIIIAWLLVCQRLDILPMELQYMIIEYVVADIRLCDKVRHRIFPIGGFPNTYTYNV